MKEAPAYIVQFEIPGHPPTTNHLFINRGRLRVNSPEYRRYEAEVAGIVLQHVDFDAFRSMAEMQYELTIELQAESWLTKNGRVKKPDTPNLIKAVEDSLTKPMGIPDQFNVRTLVYKSNGPRDWTKVTFKFYVQGGTLK